MRHDCDKLSLINRVSSNYTIPSIRIPVTIYKLFISKKDYCREPPLGDQLSIHPNVYPISKGAERVLEGVIKGSHSLLGALWSERSFQDSEVLRNCINELMRGLKD